MDQLIVALDIDRIAEAHAFRESQRDRRVQDRQPVVHGLARDERLVTEGRASQTP